MDQRIEKRIELKAPLSRVWRALTDHREFGQWFGVHLDAPFALGDESTGHITYPGYEHLRWHAVVALMEPENRFAFTWHPYAIDPELDYSGETPTLVEFTLQPVGAGTRLTIIETGFDTLPAHRRDKTLRMNDEGWREQCESIARYLDDAAR